MKKKSRRLYFRPWKYAGLNLLLAKWLRKHALASSYYYVTLGGTELKDVVNLDWIDRALGEKIFTYENDSEKCKLANQTAALLRSQGIDIQIIEDDIFNYRRASDTPHIFYLDLLGICSRTYQGDFAKWFEEEVLRPNDLIIITSYLSRNPGWDIMLQPFDAEFKMLRLNSLSEKKTAYRAHHPLFVLNRSLNESQFQNDIELRGVGFVKYRDTSTMGIYGVLCREGKTTLLELVKDFPQITIS